MIGKILSMPFKILNIPARTLEKLVGDIPKEDRIASKPLQDLIDAIEEIDK